VCLESGPCGALLAVLPCGHRCVCGGCAAALLQQQRKCPKCRQEMTGALRVCDE
jgi:hypothetical protein